VSRINFLKKEDINRLNAFEMKLYRWILEIRWYDYARNTTIMEHIGAEESISCIIKKRQLKWH